MYDQVGSAQYLGQANMAGGFPGAGYTTPQGDERRPMKERLSAAKEKEAATIEGLKARIRRSEEQIEKMEEAIQLCEQHPSLVRLFELLIDLEIR